MTKVTAVVGLGEVGRPLLQLIERTGLPAAGIDVGTASYPDRGSVGVMHICFPFEIDDFAGETTRYIELLAPELTVVNSTVAVGTTRAIQEAAGGAVAYSPIRGKHAVMLDELTRYVKFVGAGDEATARRAAEHFQSLGMKTQIVASAETAELAKLTETTYFGLLIAWAQTVDRWCDELEVDYDEVASFYDEISFFPPVRYFPGVIGGHCTMPNIELLARSSRSPFLDAIRSSNAERQARQESDSASVTSPSRDLASPRSGSPDGRPPRVPASRAGRD
jgi:UDP-N-acetyl-D-mannosaminuronate dehydrogenase